MSESRIAALRLDAITADLSSYKRMVQPKRWIEAASFDACVRVNQVRC